MTFSFSNLYPLLLLTLLASNIFGQSTFDPYLDRNGASAPGWSEYSQDHEGEYKLFTRNFPWSGTNQQLSVSAKIELVSFPFLPIHQFDHESSRVIGVIPNSYYDPLKDEFDVHEYYNPGTNSVNWTFSQDVLKYKNNALKQIHIMERVLGGGENGSNPQPFGGDFNGAFNVLSNLFSARAKTTKTRQYLFHSVLKHTIYLHPANSDRALDSLVYILDLTRGRMKYYPYTNDSDPFKINTNAEIHDITVIIEAQKRSNYEGSSHTLTSEHTNATHNIFNFYPKLSRNCWQDEVFDEFLPPYGNNSSIDSRRLPEYSTLTLRPSGPDALNPVGYKSENGELVYRNGSNQLSTFTIDHPIDLTAINPTEQVIYNPEEVEIDLSGDTLVFPEGYTFKTVLGNYTSQTTVENQDTNEYYKNSPLKIHVPNDTNSGGYIGKYIVKSGSTLKIEGCVTLMDVEIELESGATLMIDTSSISSINLDLDTSSGTVVYTNEDGCSDCNFDPDLVEEQLDIIQGIYGSSITLSDTNLLVVGDLTISGNSTLTINQGSKLLFAPEARIVIEDGSTMDINGTSSDTIKFLPFCHKPWNGIEVHSDINNTSHSSAGKVDAEYLQIEGARTAFKSYSSDRIEAEGGEIKLKYSLVKNNQKGIDFRGHRSDTMYNASSIKHSKFVWDENISPFLFNSEMLSSSLLHINLENQNGLFITGSEFFSELNTKPHLLGKGLSSFDSQYWLGHTAERINCEDTPYDFDSENGCSALIEEFNTFSNLSIGITNRVLAHPHRKNIHFTSFDSCFVGVLLFSSTLDYIDKNLFNVPPSKQIGYENYNSDLKIFDKPVGLYIYQSWGFLISKNHFLGAESSDLNDCQNCNYGVVLDANNNGNGLVISNNFGGTNLGLQAQNGNGTDKGTSSLDPLTAGAGVSILCNSFDSNNVKNILLPEYSGDGNQPIRNQGFCIGTDLEENIPAYNEFSDCNTDGNLFNSTPIKTFKYYDDDVVIPSICQYQVSMTSCLAQNLYVLDTVEQKCYKQFEVFSPEVTLNNNSLLLKELDEKADSLRDAYEVMSNLEDSLNLLWLIENGTDAEIFNAFDSLSGFVSDSSLEALINTSNSISDSLRIELLVDNSKLHTNVYNLIMNRTPAFADSLLDYLDLYQEEPSPKRKTEEFYDFVSFQKIGALYSMYFQNDSSDLDSIKYFLNQENIIEPLNFSFLSINNHELRDSLLQVNSEYVDSILLNVEYPIIFAIHDSISHVSSLDSAYLNELNSLVQEDSSRLAKFQVWSGARDVESFIWPINSASSGQEFVYTENDQTTSSFDTDQNDDLLVWPNPTKDKFQIRVLQNTNKVVEIKCYDIFGKVVYTNMLQNEMYSIPTPGAYIILVRFDNGETVSSKVIVAN